MQETLDFPIEVAKIVRFDREKYADSKSLGAVLMQLGPLSVWCRLVIDPNGEPFLSMPSRKGKDEKYFVTTFFTDRRLHERAQAMAVEAFKKMEVSPN
jgi:hypothetical protein